MTKNLENTENIDAMRQQIETLENKNEFLQKQNTALKMRCSNYCLQVKALEDEVADLRFTHNFLSSEEAGKMFAKSLLGGA